MGLLLIGVGGKGYNFRNAQAKTYWDALTIQNGGSPVSGSVYGITNKTLKKGIDDNFIAGTNNGWLAKTTMRIFPIGGTADTHKVNLVNPGTYNAGWVGSPTHGAAGVTMNGTTQYATTGLVPSAVLSLTSVHLSAIFTLPSGTAKCLLGSSNSATTQQLALFNSATDLSFFDAYSNGTGRATGGTAHVTGDDIGSRVSNVDSKIFLNGVEDGAVVTSNGTRPTFEIFLGARNNNGTADVYSDGTFRRWTIGEGLTAQEAADMAADDAALNTILGR